MRIYHVVHPDTDATDPASGPAAVVIAPDEDRAVAETMQQFRSVEDWGGAKVQYLGVARGPVRVVVFHQ